jgi:hypothetical protein
MLIQSYRLSTFCLLCSLLVSCSDPAPSFTNTETIKVSVGKTRSAIVNVDNWSQDTQLALVPGGPYLENKYSLDKPAQLICKSDNYVFAVDKYNKLTIIDFSVNPAKQVAQLTLEGQVTSLATHNQLLFVGFKQQGITIYNISNLPEVTTRARFDKAASVSKIKVYKEKIYALSNNTQLWVLKPAANDESNANWTDTSNIPIPAASTDFAVLDTHVLTIGPGYGLGSALLSEPEKFQSTYTLQGNAMAIKVSDGFAYVASGSGGLTLFDINNPAHPQWSGSHNKFDSINNVLISKDRAFVLDRDVRIATLSIANKSLPITGSFYKAKSTVFDILADANHAFLATEDGVEEIHFPTHPHAQISNEGINQGGTRRAYIENNIAYVADWFSGLHLYDISNPAKPRHLSNYHTPGSSKGVVVDNGYAFVGDDDHGLQIIDVSNPERPQKVSEILTTGLAYTLKKQGNLIYLADHRGGFHIIDVSNIKQPAIVSSYDTPGKSWAIDVADNITYVADDTSGLLIFDTSDVTQPKQIGQFNPQGAAEDVVVKNNLTYVSFFDKGLFILDIQNPSQPQVVAQLPIPGNARSVTLNDNYAYIAGWESGLNIVDISNPASPHIVGNYDTKGSAWGADVSNGHAFIWDWWGGVKVINIENPQQPRLVGKYHTRGEIINLKQKGNYIYTANGVGGVQVFDIKNALNPIWVTGIDFPGTTIDIWPSPSSGYAYAANTEHGLQILDISNSFYIQPVGRQHTGGETTLVREHEQTVYVANKNAGLFIYNASNPQQLIKQQELPIAVKDMLPYNKQLLIVSEEKHLIAFTIDNSGKLAKNPLTIDNNTSGVTANKTLVFSSNDNKVNLWRQTAGKFQSVADISFAEAILGMQATENELLVTTNNNGLFSYDISNPLQPVLNSYYPATDKLGHFIIKGNAVFFGGSHTIASAQQLPSLEWRRVNNHELQLTIPGNLPLGVYHLMLVDSLGNKQLWPNAIEVSFPHRKKPKLTMDQFRKLLEKHRSQQP